MKKPSHKQKMNRIRSTSEDCIDVPEYVKSDGTVVAAHKRCIERPNGNAKTKILPPDAIDTSGGYQVQTREQLRDIIRKAINFDTKRFDTKQKEERFEAAVNDLMRKAIDGAPEVDSIGNEYASRYGGTVTPVNMKTEKSIRRKVKSEYGGNIELLKDSVRNTVIVPSDKFEQLKEDLKSDSRFTRVKFQDPKKFRGYRGIVANMKLSNGLTAEVQFNTKGLIYAKEKKEIALKMITQEEYNFIRQDSGEEGGLGHVIYEEIRELESTIRSGSRDDADKKRLDDAYKRSEEYYSKFYKY